MSRPLCCLIGRGVLSMETITRLRMIDPYDVQVGSRLSNAYSGKAAMILGGAGFVGNWLRLALTAAGAHVVIVDNFSRGQRSSGWRYGSHEVRQYSVLAREALVGDMGDMDYVFNLTAAVAGVLYNENHHAEMYAANINVLMEPVLAASQAGVPAFLQTSSVCVYDPAFNAPSTESYGMSGTPHPANAGYAEAKRDGERFAIWSKVGKVVIVRPSNIAGFGDYFDDKAHVIPAFVQRAVEMKAAGLDKFDLYGNPKATREFIHPLDVARGMMSALAFGKDREAYNVGCSGENTISMEHLASKILGLVGFGLGTPVHIVVDGSRGGGDERRYSDARKLAKVSGWHHELGLNEILTGTIEDYQSYWKSR